MRNSTEVNQVDRCWFIVVGGCRMHPSIANLSRLPRLTTSTVLTNLWASNVNILDRCEFSVSTLLYRVDLLCLY